MKTLEHSMVSEINKMSLMHLPTSPGNYKAAGSNFEILLLEKDNPIYTAYHSGRLNSEIEIRDSIRKLALNGSNPAQSAIIHFRNKS